MKMLSREDWRILGCLAFIALLAIAGMVAIATRPARAHDAPLGWAYEADCCSTRDCRLVADDAIRMTADGWLVRATGEVIPYGSHKERRSPDSQFHRCSHAFAAPGATDGTICLYVTGMGS
ncbi:hypothetical protein [Microbaculum marinum]|uniref:Secreted protein n=1 Tax=Microbaculum marinum TaxID=1764581 RepID=A0AAW9RH70_9HYPH